MKYLVRVGGELHIPYKECSAGCLHYEYFDAEPVEIDVNPDKSARWYLSRLIGKLKESVWYGEPTARVNLLYGEDNNPLDLDIADLVGSETFDFFVEGDLGSFSAENVNARRFQYSGGKIHDNNRPLNGEEKVRGLFGETNNLELKYISSPGAEFHPLEDYVVVQARDSRNEEESCHKLMEQLSGYGIKDVANLDELEFSILLSVVSSDEPVTDDEIIEHIIESDHLCRCYFDEYGGGIEDELGTLVKRDLLKETEYGYVIHPQYAEVQLIRDLGESVLGVDDLEGYDIVSIGVLHSLTEGPAGTQDIFSDLKRRGIKVSDTYMKERLNELLEDGIIKEEFDSFKINPEHRRIHDYRQMSFEFMSEQEEAQE